MRRANRGVESCIDGGDVALGPEEHISLRIVSLAVRDDAIRVTVSAVPGTAHEYSDQIGQLTTTDIERIDEVFVALQASSLAQVQLGRVHVRNQPDDLRVG